MSFRRPFIFACNKCGFEAETPFYGLPKGFKWHVEGGETRHVCGVCLAELKREGRISYIDGEKDGVKILKEMDLRLLE